MDYNEKFPQSDIEKILSSENPQETFCEIVTEWDCRSDDWYYEELFWNDFRAFCKENNFDEDEARDVVYGNFYWTYPSDFLNPMVNTVWTINTGDLNYDFSCHNVLNYCGNGVLEEPAGLYWLAKQQGRLSLLKKEIKKSDRYHDGECEQSKFVESCITELVNVTSMLTHLTFLVKMPLLDAIKIIEAYNEAEKLGKFKYLYPQGIKEDIGYVILSKDTLCGLYDSINGGGSMLEIELEKDVKIPLQYIWRIETNKDIQGCYGMTESCWKETVKKIDIKELL